MAKKKKPARYYVEVLGNQRKMDYSEGRDRLERSLRSYSTSSGMALWDDLWDCCWHTVTKARATRLAAKARRFKFVKSVRVKQIV